MRVDNLRNIAIIAHVDHGKTTMVDKLPVSYTHLCEVACSDSPARTESTLSALRLVRNSRSTSHAAGQPGPTRGSIFKKAVGAQCADRRYMGSDIF